MTACGKKRPTVGVLLCVVEPVAGIRLMREARRKARRDGDIGSDRARLTQARDITGDRDGMDRLRGVGVIRRLDDDTLPPNNPAMGLRIISW